MCRGEKERFTERKAGKKEKKNDPDSRKFNKTSSKGPDIEKGFNSDMQERNQREELLCLAEDGGEGAQGRHVK